MLELLALLMVVMAFGPLLYLAHALSRLPPSPVFELRAPLETGSAEPCWTEAIVSDGRYHYARSECVDDWLMELDARAKREDFPIRNAY